MHGTRLATWAFAAGMATCAGAARAQAVPERAAIGAPADARAPEAPVAWSSLTPTQQHLLAPVRDQWDALPGKRQQRLVENATRWATLPPARQQQATQRLARWARMTPEQRRELQQNARTFRNLTPEQRARIREAFVRFQSLPPDQRKALRERWRSLSPAERMRWAEDHRAAPGAAGIPKPARSRR